MGTRSTVQADRLGNAERRTADDPVGGAVVASTIAMMVEKLQHLEKEVSDEKGSFDLFGVFLREDSAGRWDVVAAARWFGDDKREALEFLSARLKRSLGSDGMVLISRIVPLASHDRFLEAVREAVSVQHGLREISDVEFAGVHVARGYVITSRPLSERSRMK